MNAAQRKLDIIQDLPGFARGRPCQFRIPGICNHDSATSVWCHVPRGGVAGGGQKAPDICGGIGCSACHDWVDGRTQQLPASEECRDTLILEGVLRSQAMVWKEAGL